MYKNYKDLLQDFEDLSMKHRQVNSYGFGDIQQISYFTEARKKGIVSNVEDNQDEGYHTAIYPLIYVVPGQATIDGGYKVLNFNILFMDIVKPDYSNETQVFSDTLQIAEDWIARFRYGTLYDKYMCDLPVNLTPFSERFDDFVDGWNLPLSIRVESVINECDTPFEETEYLIQESGDYILQENNSKIETE